ncbi:hypothetical protein L1889_03890 [Paenalcaligenes niemegkensis]|uniref:hypothetical protein n=1 Tax=Paenalcaligenes niemegkensis TaxID=2895469 RepID=UPI001EE9A79E|nr:hypothetical protein [Paenalcaligenes niemegkensis]MCQ9615951.1 hypothetical protein [Paenalcaligenes niemegkensis]
MLSIIEKYDLFVKDQIAHQERTAVYYAEKNDRIRADGYADRAEKLQEMWSAVTDAIQSIPSPNKEAQFHLSPDDLAGLPDELVKELGITDSDRKEYLLIDLINNLGGIASINKLLISIYKETGEIEKRTRLVARLYRMQNKGMIYTTSERKGVYSTTPIPDGYFDTKDLEDGADEVVDE